MHKYLHNVMVIILKRRGILSFMVVLRFSRQYLSKFPSNLTNPVILNTGFGVEPSEWIGWNPDRPSGGCARDLPGRQIRNPRFPSSIRTSLSPTPAAVTSHLSSLHSQPLRRRQWRSWSLPPAATSSSSTAGPSRTSR
jgi:hypothetical protein